MTDDKKQNPWRLTPKQCAVMRTLSEVGTVRGTANRLGLSCKTTEEHLRLAKRAMGVDNMVQAAVAWDRYSSGRIEAPARSVFQFRGWSGNESIRRAA